MKLDVRNFGIIEYATVNIKGLTVICGENDTGKSTIGKLLFAIIKACQKYEDDLGENIIDKVIYNISRIISLISNSNEDREIYDYFRRISRNIMFHKELLTSDEIKSFYKIIKENIRDENIKDELISNIYSIEKIMQEKPNEEKLKESALKKAIYSEFQKIRNECYILLSENDNCLIEFSMLNSNITNLRFENKMDVEDITYIESPFILQFRRMFMNAMTLLDDKPTRSWMRDTVSLHLKDLARKLNSYNPQRNNFIRDKYIKEISEGLDDLIGGDFYYDENHNDFILSRKNMRFPLMNIASGIKSLGLINTLLKGNIINKNSLLIIDEPETNLHPKWQNEYAKLICELVKNDIKIVTVTHSPYMVSALENYSRSLSNKHFYWANKTGNDLVTFEDKTDSIMRDILQKFANSFDEL